jgi:hypothetical protein
MARGPILARSAWHQRVSGKIIRSLTSPDLSLMVRSTNPYEASSVDFAAAVKRSGGRNKQALLKDAGALQGKSDRATEPFRIKLKVSLGPDIT